MTNIQKAIWGAFGYLYEYRASFIKALLIPVSMLVVLDFFPKKYLATSLSFALFVIVSWFIYSIIAITTHRIILLGPESVKEWGIYIPGKRESKFILYSIGVGLLMMPFTIISLVPVIGWIIGLGAMLYVVPRLSLIFPAIATEQDWTIKDSWVATSDHAALMIVVVAIFPIVMGIPFVLISLIPHTGLIVSVLTSIILIVTIAALSVAFQIINEKS